MRSSAPPAMASFSENWPFRRLAFLGFGCNQLSASMRPTEGKLGRLAPFAVGLGKVTVAAIGVRRANSPPDCLPTLLTLNDAA